MSENQGYLSTGHLLGHASTRSATNGALDHYTTRGRRPPHGFLFVAKLDHPYGADVHRTHPTRTTWW